MDGCVRETSIGCLLHAPHGAPPKHVPYPGIEPATFWFAGNAQLTEPHQSQEVRRNWDFCRLGTYPNSGWCKVIGRPLTHQHLSWHTVAYRLFSHRAITGRPDAKASSSVCTSAWSLGCLYKSLSFYCSCLVAFKCKHSRLFMFSWQKLPCIMGWDTQSRVFQGHSAQRDGACPGKAVWPEEAPWPWAGFLATARLAETAEKLQQLETAAPTCPALNCGRTSQLGKEHTAH